VRRADNLTTFLCRFSRNYGASTSWNPEGLSRHVAGKLYLLHISVAVISIDQITICSMRFQLKPRRLASDHCEEERMRPWGVGVRVNTIILLKFLILACCGLSLNRNSAITRHIVHGIHLKYEPTPRHCD
jgi:hypothetical protein